MLSPSFVLRLWLAVPSAATAVFYSVVNNARIPQRRPDCKPQNRPLVPPPCPFPTPCPGCPCAACGRAIQRICSHTIQAATTDRTRTSWCGFLVPFPPCCNPTRRPVVGFPHLAHWPMVAPFRLRYNSPYDSRCQIETQTLKKTENSPFLGGTVSLPFFTR